MKNIHKTTLVATLLCLIVVSPVYADTSSSSNYRVEETFFGTGGEVDASSTNYRSQQSAGSLGVGSASSNNYDIEGGFVTENEPYLELFVNTTTVDLGVLDTAATSTGTATFRVRTYLTSGYVVKTMSPPPTSEGGAQLDPMTTTAAPTPGTEQFGINLIDNSSPDIGANASNYPDNSFADGEIASGYDVLNQFKYNQGDTIARSQKTAGNQAVGRTDYTISYVANAGAITEAGEYVMYHDIVVIPTF